MYKALTIPPHWPQLNRPDFYRFLRNCADYRREDWGAFIEYYSVHNKKVFAYEPQRGPIRVDPQVVPISEI